MEQVGKIDLTKNYSAALYLRLSKDDEGGEESASIGTQRKMLREYAKENGFCIYDEYVDDGYSGTNFDRPNFQRMISDIEQKKVNMVITKDLSRLGRDYILTGQYTEIYFPSKKVRYIAINDGYDSDSPYTDIAPFKNIINEMYARDISKKIRSAFVTKMKEGSFISPFAPYGYQRDPQDKGRLVIDRNVSEYVKEIFQKTANGILPIQIARDFNTRGIPSPMVYRCSQHPNMNIEQFSKRQEWTSATISKLLKNEVYVGVMMQGKTSKVSFKSNIVVKNAKEAWYKVENTHEALVSREMFELAQKRSHQRRCVPCRGFYNVFSGIAKCADCGRNMSAVGTRKKGATANLACGGYKSYGKNECGNHFINYDILCQIVLSTIREAIHISCEEADELIEQAGKVASKQTEMKAERRKQKTELQKRQRELDALIERLYEDRISGLLSESRMQKLLQKYEKENEQILNQLDQLEHSEQVLLNKENQDQLKMILREITEPCELTRDVLFRLIEKIEVEQGHFEKIDGARRKIQTIRIHFRFLGVPMQKTYQM